MPRKLLRCLALSAASLGCVFLGSAIGRAATRPGPAVHDVGGFVRSVEAEAIAEFQEVEVEIKREETAIEAAIRNHREVGRDPLLLPAVPAPAPAPAAVPAAMLPPPSPPLPPTTVPPPPPALPPLPLLPQPQPPAEVPQLPAPPALPAECHAQEGVDRPGNDLSKQGQHAESPGACCDQCTANPACAAWSYQLGAESCWLKDFDAPAAANPHDDCCVSGLPRRNNDKTAPTGLMPPPVVKEQADASGQAKGGGSSDRKARASDALGTSTVVLIIAHNRPTYLSRCLTAVQRHHPGGNSVPVMVSEDRDGESKGREVTQVIESAATKLRAAGAAAVDHVKFPDGGGGAPGYARLARHYKWALTTAFASHSRVRRVIVL
jgi:hypothetical protein